MIKSHYLQSACKRCCLTLLFLISLTSFNASSSDFTVDGLSYTFLSLEDLTCEVSGWDGKGDRHVIIPAIVTYKGRDVSVIKIGNAFSSSDKLRSLTMSSSILKIAPGAFQDCHYLREVNLSEELTEIPMYAFDHCESLKSIIIPSKVQFIEYCAFQDCSNLVDIICGESLENIGAYAFMGCVSLQNIDFRKVKGIGLDAFSGCKSLSDVIIPSTLEEIWSGAFYAITLESFKIEDSEQSISIGYAGDYCTAKSCYFYIGRNIIKKGGDNQLEVVDGGRLELGKNATVLNNFLIKGWENISFLISHNLTPPSIPEMSNSGYVNIEVRVPAEALEAYKQAPVWKNFWNIKAIEDESGISDIECDDDDSFQVYDTNGILVDASCTSEKLQQFPHGIYIVVKQDKRLKIKI